MDESDKGPLGFQPTPLTGERVRTRSPAQIFNARKEANLPMSGGAKALRGSGERKTGNCDRFLERGTAGVNLLVHFLPCLCLAVTGCFFYFLLHF